MSRKGPITDGTNQTLIFDVFFVFGGDAPYQEPTGNSKHAKACKGVRSVSIMIYYKLLQYLIGGFNADETLVKHATAVMGDYVILGWTKSKPQRQCV